MLKKLKIDQFVIIDHLELDWNSGLTILTGETGAGKSILLDAMGLVLGDATERESIRAGSDQSVIEAEFVLPSTHPVWNFLIEKKVVESAGEGFSIYRVLKRVGEDDIRFNGKPIDIETLKQIGTYLVEIHGQFANQSLLAPDNQLNLLDLSGGFPPEIFKNVADALADVRRLTKGLEDENTFLARIKRDIPKIEQLMRKFDSIEMRVGFIEEAEAEYARLLTAKETGEAFQNILSQLIAANGVVMGLANAHHVLTSNPNLDAEKMETLTGQLSTALDNARGAVKEMRRVAPDYDIDTGPLEHYTHVLIVLDEISKDAKIPFEQLTDFYSDISSKLKRFKAGQQTVARMQDELIQAKNKYRAYAQELHDKRVVAAEKLGTSITNELAPLKLQRAEFKVKVDYQPTMEWTEKGLDEVTFTARMNPGMPFSPVAETASGGELARLILAMKVVVQRVQTIPTLIFDEVDTGIGGAAAAAVGERIALLAANTQVLVITHSPQVASRNNQHLHVSKKSDGVTTLSNVRQLTIDESIDEISRMLAGDVITAESQAAARSLIEEARNAASSRNQGNEPVA